MDVIKSLIGASAPLSPQRRSNRPTRDLNPRVGRALFGLLPIACVY